jgi:hypothetical protein
MLTTAIVALLAYRVTVYGVRTLMPESKVKDTLVRIMIGPYPTIPK